MEVDALSKHMKEFKLDTLYQERGRWVQTLKTYRDQQKDRMFTKHLTREDKTLAVFEKLARLDGAVEVPLIVLDHKYHPCTAGLEALRKVTIADLVIENRHPGTFLLVRSISPATQTWSRLLAHVKDEKGDSCVLTFNQHMRDVPAEEFIPEGAVLAIKHPHLHIDSVHPARNAQGHYSDRELIDGMSCVIRVDHPADLVVLPASDGMVPSQWRPMTAPGNAISWKEQGNFAFAENRFLQAHRCYTEGIKLTPNDQSAQKLAADLYRNRARTGLSLSFYDDAKSDALMSVSLLQSVDKRTTDLNTKALFRAATAAYRLGYFMESEALLDQLNSLSHDDRAATLLASKVKQRLREQEQGSYNFDKIRERIQDCGEIDAASFTRKTEVRSMPGGGTGLFAVQDIQAGSLVLCEKALVIVAAEDVHTKPAHMVVIANNQVITTCGTYDAALWKNAIDKITRNKSTTTQLDDLDTQTKEYYCNTHPRPTEGAYDDVFYLARIVSGYSEYATHSAEPNVEKRSGFWVQQSQMNHSCMPNTASAFIGDLVVVHATRAISSGEQLFSKHFAFHADYDMMKTVMHSRPRSFRDCDCKICVAEQQTSLAQRATRREIIASLDNFGESVRSLSGLSTTAQLDALMKQGEEFKKKLTATYDDGAFTDVMPRRALALLNTSLEAIRMFKYIRTAPDPRQDVGETLMYLLEALRAQGCRVAIDSAGNVSFANMYHPDLIMTEYILRQCSRVAMLSGHSNTSLQFLNLSKETHLLQHCDLAEFR